MDFHISGTFRGANGRQAIAYYLIPPQGMLRGVVQISHGMCEYFRRYADFIRALNQRGFAVAGNDHMGHGASADSKDALGLMARGDSWRHEVDDLYAVTKLAKAAFPGVPYVLFGHSMGSFLARAYLSQYGEALDGAILCGTGGPNPLIGFGIAIARLTALLRGPAHRSNFINRLAFGSYAKKCDAAVTGREWISRDQDIVQKYIRDPYCNFVFSAAAFRELFLVNRFVNVPDWPASVPDIPIFLISGDMDPVGDYGRGVCLVDDALRRAGKHSERKLYPQARHELLNEINRRSVTTDILAWIESRVL